MTELIPDNIKTKTCYVCKQNKPIDDFYNDKTRSGQQGKSSRCKYCSNHRPNGRKRDIVKHRIYDRKYWLTRRYKITMEQFTKMISDQDSKCAICNVDLVIANPSKDKVNTMHIDHDHNTGKIRALLCKGCNVGLGFFKDNQERLQKAAEYLNKYFNMSDK
jgi:hypothetical protein